MVYLFSVSKEISQLIQAVPIPWLNSKTVMSWFLIHYFECSVPSYAVWLSCRQFAWRTMILYLWMMCNNLGCSVDTDSRECLLLMWSHVLLPVNVNYPAFLAQPMRLKSLYIIESVVSLCPLPFWVLWLMWICVVTGCFPWGQQIPFVLERGLEFCVNILTLMAIRNC